MKFIKHEIKVGGFKLFDSRTLFYSEVFIFPFTHFKYFVCFAF